MLVVGSPGAGKSALLARFVQLLREPGDFVPPLPFERLAIAHMCRGAVDEPKQFIQELALNLAARSQAFTNALIESLGGGQAPLVRTQQRIDGVLGSAIRGESSSPTLSIQSVELDTLPTEVAFRRAIAIPLWQMAKAGDVEPVLIIVNGLDAASTASPSDNLLTLLATATTVGTVPKHVRFLISTRPDTRVLLAMPGERLDLEAHAAVTDEDLRIYAYERFAEIPENDRLQMTERVVEIAAGNFLYAKALINTQLAAGVHSQAASQLWGSGNVETATPPLLADSLRQSLRQVTTFDTERWTRLYRPFFGTLAVAYDPLTLAQISGIVGQRRSETADVVRAMSQFLHGRMPDGPLSLFHNAFAQFLLNDAECGIDAAEAHERIARYFFAAYGHDWRLCETATR